MYLYKHMFSLSNCHWQNPWYDNICIFLESELYPSVLDVQTGTERMTFSQFRVLTNHHQCLPAAAHYNWMV